MVRSHCDRPFVPTCGADQPPRAGAVIDGRRPPPKAARSVIDGPEHGGRIALDGSETKKTVAHPDPLPPQGGEGNVRDGLDRGFHVERAQRRTGAGHDGVDQLRRRRAEVASVG